MTELPCKCMTCGKVVNYGSKEMDDHRKECVDWVRYEVIGIN